tara:strand:+ start:3501 stop:4505 length:1005 start_codon:yes stop_codon:yes gene_type:complete
MAILNIGIYGIGNFGYAILKHLSKKNLNHKLYCFDRNKDVLSSILENNRHSFLHTDYKINNNINVCLCPIKFIEKVDVLILCVTSDAINEVSDQLKKYSNKKLLILNTAKALCKNSGQTISSIFSTKLNSSLYEYGMLAGGTIASDLFKEEPLGITIAFKKKKAQLVFKSIFSNKNLKVYTSSDVIGVEYASAFKNIIAILAGIVSGLNYSFGSETHLISVASGEVKDLVINFLGGKSETFMMESQCWGNDLWMSCLGNSRNRKLGVLIAKHNSFSIGLHEAKKQKITVEGVNSIYSLKKLTCINHERFPILNGIASLINSKPKKIIKELFEFK